jgi:hypothetical protein
MDNSKFHTFDVKRICENKLRIEFRSGKEYNGWFYKDSRKFARITVPKGKKPIPPKTYKSMAAQLKLTIKQFDDLLNCPLLYKDYLDLIVDK